MYCELEPFGERRADYRAASIAYQVAVLTYTVSRALGNKTAKVPKFENYLLEFEPKPEPSPRARAILFDLSARIANAALRKKQKQKKAS